MLTFFHRMKYLILLTQVRMTSIIIKVIFKFSFHALFELFKSKSNYCVFLTKVQHYFFFINTESLTSAVQSFGICHFQGNFLACCRKNLIYFCYSFNYFLLLCPCLFNSIDEHVLLQNRKIHERHMPFVR